MLTQRRAAGSIKISRRVHTLALHPHGLLLATVGDGESKIALRSLPDGNSFGTVGQHDSRVQQVAFSPEGKYLVSLGYDGGAELWEVGGYLTLASEMSGASPGFPRSVAIDRQGELVAVGADTGSVRVYELVRQPEKHGVSVDPIRTLKGHSESVRSIAFGDDRLVSASCLERASSKCLGIELISFDLSTAESARSTLLESVEVETFWFSSDGSEVAVAVPERTQPAGSAPPSVYQIWRIDVEKSERVGVPIMVFDNFFSRVGYWRSDRLIAISGPNETLVWHTEDGREAYGLEGGHFAVSVDGRPAITAAKPDGLYSDYSIFVWDGTSGVPRGSIATGLTDLGAATLSPDGAYAAVSDGDGSVQLWDLSARRVLGEFKAAGQVAHLSFSAAGDVVLAIDLAGGIAAFTTNTSQWADRACAVANRNMSYEEWRQVHADQDYRLTCARAPVHESVLNAGRALADEGDVDGAEALMRHAIALGDRRISDPHNEAIERAYNEFRFRGGLAADAGDAPLAEEMFSRAQSLRPDEEVEAPALEARKLSAVALKERSLRMARLDLTEVAVVEMRRALELRGNLAVDSSEWFELCLAGIASGDATLVANACDASFSEASQAPNNHDGRGIVSTLLGESDTAVREFEAFLEFEKQPMRFRGDRRFSRQHHARVRTWMERLQAGQPPFAGFDLAEIRTWRAEPPGMN